MMSYNWDEEFSRNEEEICDPRRRISFMAIKSCIEADEPRALGEVLGAHRNANIYAMLLCFSMRPSVRCIEYLVSNGTPLDETFPNNPFHCSPQEYLDSKFPTVAGRSLARIEIEKAIAKGKERLKNRETHFVSSVKENSQATATSGAKSIIKSMFSPVLSVRRSFKK